MFGDAMILTNGSKWQTTQKMNTKTKLSEKDHSFSMLTHLSIWLSHPCPNHHCLKGWVLDLFYSLCRILRMILHSHMHTCVFASYVQEREVDFGDHFYNDPIEDLELNSKMMPWFSIHKILHLKNKKVETNLEHFNMEVNMEVKNWTHNQMWVCPRAWGCAGKEITYILQQFSWRSVTFQGAGNQSEKWSVYPDQIFSSEMPTATYTYSLQPNGGGQISVTGRLCLISLYLFLP